MEVLFNVHVGVTAHSWGFKILYDINSIICEWFLENWFNLPSLENTKTKLKNCNSMFDKHWFNIAVWCVWIDGKPILMVYECQGFVGLIEDIYHYRFIVRLDNSQSLFLCDV